VALGIACLKKGDLPQVKNGLREIAARGLKSRGPRMDAVFYLLDAMRLFRGKSLKEITFNPVLRA